MFSLFQTLQQHLLLPILQISLTMIWFLENSRIMAWKIFWDFYKFILWDMLLLIMLLHSILSMCVRYTTYVYMINDRILLLAPLVIFAMNFYLQWKLLRIPFVSPTSQGIQSFPLTVSVNNIASSRVWSHASRTSWWLAICSLSVSPNGMEVTHLGDCKMSRA